MTIAFNIVNKKSKCIMLTNITHFFVFASLWVKKFRISELNYFYFPDGRQQMRRAIYLASVCL